MRILRRTAIACALPAKAMFTSGEYPRAAKFEAHFETGPLGPAWR